MENGLTASDVALLSNRDGGFGDWGGNSMMWIFALLILANGGLGGWGNNAALGYSNLATQNDVQRGFDTLGLQDQSRDILTAINNGTAQTVAATNQAKYDNINVAKDIQSALTAQLGEIKVGQANALANQNECCCNTLRAIDNNTYQNALNTAQLMQRMSESDANTVAQTQKILDAITGNRMADMQNQINRLELQNQLAGVVRYPNGWAYDAGASPFCRGCCGGMMQ